MLLPIQFNPKDTATGASGAATTLTYPANGIGSCHVLQGVAWSYSAAPTGGSLTISDGTGNAVFGPHPITTGGLQSIVFFQPMQGTSNAPLVITLAAPGGSVVGSVTGLGHYTTNGLPVASTSGPAATGPQLDFSQSVYSEYLPLFA